MKDARSIFAQALAEVVIPEILNESETINLEHKFSKSFEKKMSKIVKVKKKPRRKIVNLTTRFVACAAAVIIVADVFKLFTNAGRNPAVDYIMIHHYNNDEVVYEYNLDIPFPRTIKEEYTIDLPEGFVLVDEYRYDSLVEKHYEKDDKFIQFTQEILSGGRHSLDNETGTNEIVVDDNETKFVVHHDYVDNLYLIFWSNDIYMFTIYSNLDEKAVWDLCNSTKIK